MIKKFIVLLSLLSLPPKATSQCEVIAPCSTKKTNYLGKMIVDRPNVVYSDSEQVLREGKRFIAKGGIGLIGTFVGFGYFLNPDTIINASFASQDALSGKTFFSGVGVSHFVLDSFYGRLSFSLRKSETFDYQALQNGKSGREYPRDVGVDFGIGNQISYKDFVFGAEWLALYFPTFRIDENPFSPQYQYRLTYLSFGFQW